VARRRGKKEKIFASEKAAPAIHTRKIFSKKTLARGAISGRALARRAG
jgi:hypothetical protein